MFTWNDYLTLAESLASSSDEAALRTAISRAYYASFHTAEDICRDLHIAVPRFTAHGGWDSSVHSRVIAALRAHPNPHLQHAGKLLTSMRKSRNTADYQLPFGMDVHKGARKAILDAKCITEEIDKFWRTA